MKGLRILALLFVCAAAASADYVVEWTAPIDAGWSVVLTAPPEQTLDVDGDGMPDVFITDSAALSIYSGVTHSLIWSLTTSGYAMIGSDGDWDDLFIRVANTDADPAKELVFVAMDLNDGSWVVYVYDCQTHELEFMSPDYASQGCLPSLADIDGDGRCEILIPDDDLLYVYGHDGSAVDEARPGEPVTSAVSRTPSPTAHSVAFSIVLQRPGRVSIDIRDVAGRVVRTISLLGGPGRRVVRWDCSDDSGAPVPTGTYFYRCGENSGRVEVVR